MANLFTVDNGKITYNNVSNQEFNSISEMNKRKQIKQLKNNYKVAQQNVTNDINKIGNYLNRNGQNVNINNPFQANVISNAMINTSKKNLNGRVTLQDVVQDHTNLMNTEQAKQLKNDLRISKNERAWAGYNYAQEKVNNEDTTLADKTIGNVTRGIKDLFSNMTDSRDVVDDKGNTIRLPSYNELKQNKVSQDYKTGIGKFLGDATYNISKIGSSTLMNIPTLGVGGSAIYWSDMFADGLNSAKNQGYDDSKAVAYAIGNTSFEFLVGKFLGSATKGLTGGKASVLSNAISNGVNKFISNPKIASIIGNAGSEATEEFIQEYLDNINKLVTLEGSKNVQDYIDVILDKDILKDAIYSAGVGAVSGGVLQGTNNSEGKYAQYNTNLLESFKEQLERSKSTLTDKKTIEKYNQVINDINDYISKPFGNESKVEKILPTVQDIVNREQNTKILPTEEDIVMSEKKGNTNIPIRNYQYIATGNTKIDNLRQDMSKYWTDTNETKALGSVIEKIITDKGYNVRLDNTIKNKEGNSVNAQITTLNNGEVEIRINPNAKNVGEFLIMHEVTHAVETQEMKDLVLDYASKHSDFNKALESLKQTYGTNDVSSEVLADISGQLFGNQEFINNLSMQQPNVFKRIYNKIVELTNKITGNSNEALFIRDLKNKWETAYRNTSAEQAISNLNNESIYSIMQNSKGKYVKADRQVITGNNPLKWETQVENYINNSIRNGKDVDIFTDNGDILTITADTAGKAKFRNFYLDKNGQKHYMNDNEFFTKLTAETHIDELAEVSKQKNKVPVPDYKNHSFAKDGFNYRTAFFEDFNGEYYKITMSVGKNGQINTIYNVGKLEQRKRPVINGSSVNNGADGSLTGNNIPQSNKNVKSDISTKYSMQENQNNATDNKGRQLSKEQQEYFKDSKVRDKNGNLFTVYHGTDANFNVFTDEYMGKNQGNSLGQGYYFTTNKNRAETYGTKTKETYINIENPFDVYENGDLLDKAEYLMLKYDVPNIDDDAKTYHLDYVKSKLKRNYSAIDYLKSLAYKNNIKTSEILKELGYDGVKADDEYVVFNSNQIKNVDNINPTNDPDIRYSQNSTTWQEYLDKHYKPTGTRTNMQDIKIPIRQEIVNKEHNSEINTLGLENDKVAQLLDKRPLEKQKGLSEELNKVYQKIVDKGKYVADLAKKTGNKELYAKYDQMGTARGSAEYSIGVAQINNEGKKVGKSLIDIWNPIIESGKEFDFSLYLLHKHNIDRYRQGKPVFGEKITSEISQNEVVKYEEKNPQFIEWSKDINKYNKNLLQNMVDAGITTEESQKYYNETYSNYVKIYRDITGNSPITIQNGKIKINSPIKTAKGGNQDILPLKDSMAQQTLEVTSAVRRNQFGLELLETLGNGKEVTEYGKEIIEKNDDGTYSFTVFKDGKPVKIEIDEGLYESIKPSKKSSIEDLLPVKGARVLLKFQRGLITDKNPFFLIRNFFKDLGDAPLNSKYTSKFFPNFARAYYEITTNGEYAQLYKALGGYQQSYFDNDSGLKIPSNKKTAKFIRAIQSLNQAVEMAPRLAEFISSIEAGETIQSSMYNAAEITTNFKRGGEVSKALNRNFSNFLNASIQGFDKQFRNFTGQNGAKGYINLLSKAVIFGVLPSMLNHLLLDDDEDYEDLPDYIKDNYYLFKKSDNNFIRIPKGRVISIFGNAAYRTYEYLQGDKDAYKGFIENAITNVAPNNPIGSNVLSPFIQVATNKSWNGSEIVPQRLQDLPPAEQFDEKTDELSKAIGKLFNISPKKVNYLLDQYSGVFGDTLLPMMTPQAENNPLISAFTVNSVTTNKYSSEFYDIKDKVTKKANSVNSTVADELQKKYLSAIQTEMSKLYKEKRELQMSDVKDSEKRKLVEKVQAEINKIAKEGLDNYQDVSSHSNYGKVAENEFFLNTKKEWTKVKEEEADELNDLNMNADDKNKYFIAKNEITVVKSDENMNPSIKHTQIANIVMNSNLNDEYKGYLYGKYYSSEEKINNVLNAGISFDEYLKFNSQEFTTDYYTNGKAVPNSRKRKVIQYVNNLNLSIPQKALLIKMEYSSYDKYDKQISQYVNSKNLTFLEKASILKQAGFTSYDKQIIKYVNNMNITKSEKEEILEEMGFKIRNGRVYTK